MSTDELAKLLEAFSKLVSAILWPGLLLFVIIAFMPDLKSFFSNLSEFSLKGAGFEASAKRIQADATAALVAASVSRPQEGATTETAAKKAKAAAEIVAEAATPTVIRRVSGSSVLWVDDNPSNN